MFQPINAIISILYISIFTLVTIISSIIIFPVLIISIICAFAVIFFGLLSNITFKASTTMFLGIRNFLHQVFNKIKSRMDNKTTKK